MIEHAIAIARLVLGARLVLLVMLSVGRTREELALLPSLGMLARSIARSV